MKYTYKLAIISAITTTGVVSVANIPQIINPSLTFAIKLLLWLDLAGFALTAISHLGLSEEISNLKLPSHSWINTKCFKLDIIEERIHGSTCYITVKCKDKLIREGGCPINCPNFHRPAPSGAGGLGGAIAGAIIGEILFPGGGFIPGAIIGALWGLSSENVAIKSPLERKIEECKSKRKGIIIHYTP